MRHRPAPAPSSRRPVCVDRFRYDSVGAGAVFSTRNLDNEEYYGSRGLEPNEILDKPAHAMVCGCRKDEARELYEMLDAATGVPVPSLDAPPPDGTAPCDALRVGMYACRKSLQKALARCAPAAERPRPTTCPRPSAFYKPRNLHLFTPPRSASAAGTVGGLGSARGLM